MGQTPQDGKNGQNVAFFCFFFWALLWPNGLIFPTFLNCSEEILPVHSKNVLVLAHLEPELGLFEVDDIGDDGDDDLWPHYLPNFKQLQLGF